MGPFAANAIRTFGALPFLMILLGPRATKAALRAILVDPSGWVLGAGWLALALVPYLASLKYLPPTITTLTVYLTPLLVAGWEWARNDLPPPRLLLPTVGFTLVGGWIAISAAGGAPPGLPGWQGLGLAMLGAVGWTGYTLYLKHLTRTREADELTLVAFITSGIAFALGAVVFEPHRLGWDANLLGWILLYVMVPSVLSFFLYTRALNLVDATTIAVLLGVELVATGVVSYALTGETFSLAKLGGFALVTAAITVYLWDAHKRPSRGSASRSPP